MKRLIMLAALTPSLFAWGAAQAAEQTVKLAVSNMYCAACPATVKQSLSAVPGVSKAVVSFEEKTAVGTLDDPNTHPAGLSQEPTNPRHPGKDGPAAAPHT